MVRRAAWVAVALALVVLLAASWKDLSEGLLGLGESPAAVAKLALMLAMIIVGGVVVRRR